MQKQRLLIFIYIGTNRISLFGSILFTLSEIHLFESFFSHSMNLISLGRIFMFKLSEFPLYGQNLFVIFVLKPVFLHLKVRQTNQPFYTHTYILFLP